MGQDRIDTAGQAQRPDGRLPAGLYIVATPIGNLEDISRRAIATLAGADLIACEDTRVTAKLLSRYAIATPTTAYHEHNAEKARPRLLARIAGGAAIALVSDAGTPLISDPGYKLVRAARQAGLGVTAVPGASAVVTALALAGLPTDRFLFAGFPPSKPGQRRRFYAEMAPVPASLVLFESPHRLAASLADAAAVLGDREAAVARELTKRFEQVRTGTLGELAADYGNADPPKGEIVLVIGPPLPGAPPDLEGGDLDDRLRAAIAEHGVKAAADALALETGLAKRAVYQRALTLKDG